MSGVLPPADRLVPTELAALAAGVREATIRKWASRGKLTRYGSPTKAQYDLDELLELITARTAVPSDVADDAVP